MSDLRGNHHKRDEDRDREHGHAYRGGAGRGSGRGGGRGGGFGGGNHNVAQRGGGLGGRTDRGRGRGGNEQQQHNRSEEAKIQERLRNEHGTVSLQDREFSLAPRDIPEEPDHLKYQLGSMRDLELQLIRSRNNAYNVVAEAEELGDLPEGEDVRGHDQMTERIFGVHPKEDNVKDIYVVVNLHAIKWTHTVVFGKNTFIRKDIAIEKLPGENRLGALPGDVVVVKMLPRDQWNKEKSHEQDKDIDPNDTSIQQNEPHKPKGYATGTATLPDGRKVRKALQHDPSKRYLGKAERIHHALELGENVAEMGAWDSELQPRGIIVAVLERGFNRFQPCRLMLRTDPRKPDAPPEVPKIVANRYYTFKPFSEAYPVIAVYGDDIPTVLQDEIADTLFLIEIKCADSMRFLPKPGGRIVHSEEDDHIKRLTPERRAEVRHVDWKFPVGRVVMSLGRAGTVVAESRAIAATHQVTDREFSAEVEACVMKDFIIPTPEELKQQGRRDLRDEEFVCTIDPASARDLDDALSIAHSTLPGNAGGYRVGVHIADVSHFVPINSAMDYEAKSRSTSVYFVERVIPMLPRKLSEDYCSLNAGTDKFAFSSIFELDRDGNVVEEWFGQSVIRNRCRMAYEDAQAIIDGDKSGDSLVINPIELDEDGSRTGKVFTREEMVKKCVKSVELLFKVAAMLRKRRYDAGALSLNKSKIRFCFEKGDQKRVNPIGYTLECSKEANWTIEEFMLLCNIRSSQKIVQYLPDCGMLRKHDPPIAKKSAAFITSVREKGYEISGGSSKQLQLSLAKYKDDPNIEVLRLMATYTMSLAKYVSSGSDAEGSVRHYALATDLYTHFTSPIRRYCDIVAHRQLLLAVEVESIFLARKAAKEAANGGKPLSESEEEDILNGITLEQLERKDYYIHPADVEEIADHANTKKMNARKCSDSSLSMFLCQYLKALSKAQGYVAGGAAAAAAAAAASADGAADTIIPAPHHENPHEIARFQVRCFITKYKNEERFTLYAPDIAQDCELFHNSPTQRWVLDNLFKKETQSFICNWGALGTKEGKRALAAEPEEAENAKEIEDALTGKEEAAGTISSKKNFKKGTADDTGKQKKYNAILRSQRDTDVKEELSLFNVVVATLKVVIRGTMQIDFVVDPPWERPAEVPQIPMMID